ncbi:hypothetical protein GR217_22820 [Rhizobium leguminosarum]|uniref:Uncharacterized protein n=1 Tax=Rhizobium ruizarguesonis TaxID=2081791 RepID=A0AAE4YTA1_9HYPH|nr:hypothetical protein [Rhizobium ruizarguesonis]NEI50521.1 hypothetical protein [Rhizobium ruizarguesonis]
MSKDLGFGKSPKIDVSDFGLQKSNPTDAPEHDLGDVAAEKAGFVSRQPVERLARTRKSSEPMDTAYIRAPISVINRLKSHCNETGLSYGEALDQLLRKAGV